MVNALTKFALDADCESLKKMDEYFPTDNLHSERLVGEINYNLHIRDKVYLQTVSQKMILNKFLDLITKKNSGYFMNFFIKRLKIYRG